jgi:hypothetical protein
MRSASALFPLLMIVGPIVLPGCFGESEPEEIQTVFPVSGVVTLDGKPLTSASVQFHPQAAGSAQSVYFGTTDMEGKYELTSPRGTPGCEAGTYTVTISKFAQRDGSPLPADAQAEDFAALGVEHMPPKYNDPALSELRAVVPQGGKSDLNFPLTTQ